MTAYLQLMYCYLHRLIVHYMSKVNLITRRIILAHEKQKKEFSLMGRRDGFGKHSSTLILGLQPYVAPKSRIHDSYLEIWSRETDGETFFTASRISWEMKQRKEVREMSKGSK